MKKIFSLLVVSLLVASFFGNLARAQEANVNGEEDLPEEAPVEEIPLQAEAGSDKNVGVGRTVLFDGSGSTGPKDKTLTYFWDFGDGQSTEGLDASHIYQKAGTYRVKLKIFGGQEENTDEIIVSVEKYLAVLITDQSVGDKKIKEIEEYARTQDTLVVNIRDDSNDPDYLVTQKLANKLLNNKEDIIQSKIIIAWTSSQTGLNSLVQLANNLKAEGNQTKIEDFGFAQKTIVALADSNSSAVAKIAQNAYNILSPQEVVITKEENLLSVVEAGESEKVVQALKNKQASYQLIGWHTQRALKDLTPLNFLSYLMSYLVNKGISQDTLYLILILPVIATLVAAARQLIGFKAYGIYMPTMMTLIFLVSGIKYAIAIYFVLLIIATLARLLAKKLRVLYLPRMAIVLTAVSLTIIGIFVISALWNKTGFLAVSIFPILIMTILTEKFVEVQIEHGSKQAFKLTIETLILSIASYYIVIWQAFETMILAYPELIFITIIINILIGRFAGLRLMEYLRFRNVIKHAGDAKK